MPIVRDDQLPQGAGGAPEVPPIPSASVLVLRNAPLEVLMIRRVETSSFVPSAWVFPGGVVDDVDRELAREAGGDAELTTMRYAAARELFEETGLWLGGEIEDAEHKRRRLLAGSVSFRSILTESPLDLTRLVTTARWVTPVGVPKRFDTCFFLALAPQNAEATAHADEAADLAWIAPSEAIRMHQSGEFQMVFPTLKNLEAIAGFSSAAELLDSRRGAAITITQPRLVVENGQKRIVLDD